MFQVARPKQRQIEPARTQTVEPAHAPTVGKRTLVEGVTFGTPNYYEHAVETARREIRAVRTVALPAFIHTLRRKDLAPVAKQMELTKLAIQVRHTLMTANQHVRALEKAATFRDPMVLFLRHDLDTLAARAAKVGVFRGAEAMMPRAYVEETRQPTARGESALLVRKSSQTAHRVAPIASSSLQAPVAKPAAPRPRLARGTPAPARAMRRTHSSGGDTTDTARRRNVVP